MQKYAVIVAGGSGTRMGGTLPKQFVELGGVPVLMHTLRLFDGCDRCVLVLPADRHELWHHLCQKHDFYQPVELVTGGDSRFQSVANGLARVPDGVLVAVHDAVRPFVSRATLAQAFQSAAGHGCGIPVVEPVDSLRLLDGADSRALDRSQVRVVQTPQVFRSTELKRAYAAGYRPVFTDDASVWEAAGYPVHLVDGNPENIKLTRPQDLPMAEILLQHGPY
ncbi:MAG: 2-C-methyl-D-erythritol 4-phosphate cytidylyltransferase [Paludibacteraceae bacterium]|nr:2-C-methyl-D-erythritol 4-phosphate cytidylyltransferase [Paludibacteraceae bacterium]